MASFIRKVPTASGARAVQIVHKHGRKVVRIDHIGSAHNDAQLAVLMEAALQRLHPGQDTFDLAAAGAGPVSAVPGAQVAGMRSQILWDVLTGAYERLGFGAVADETFMKLVLARIIEPASKADTIRVLEEIGVTAPSSRTIFRSLGRCVERDYRDVISKACVARSAGTISMIMYDVTTLHFEAEKEDTLRRVGMSKEHRVDPQVQVGLLVDPGGFPLEIHLFEGNKAETKTLIPVLTAFQDRHRRQGVKDMVVVADAGMLSAANPECPEEAGFSFIVGSRISKAPYDLAEHFTRHGDYFTDAQILESARVMGTGKAARERRVIYQYKFTRYQHDNRAINAMVERAEKITTGASAMAKARFVKVTGATRELDQPLIDRARQLAGLKGYVTNLPIGTMGGQAVIDAYHDLYQVERSFRMAKNDLRARPVFHRERDAIEAHLTVVFAALAIARDLQAATGVSLKKLIQTLRPLRTVTVALGGHTIEARPQFTDDSTQILAKLPPLAG